jgi:hypothetical protein
MWGFDLIELNGDDLRRDPLVVRKATLASVLARAAPGLRFNEHIEEDGPTVFAHAMPLTKAALAILNAQPVRCVAVAGIDRQPIRTRAVPSSYDPALMSLGAGDGISPPDRLRLRQLRPIKCLDDLQAAARDAAWIKKYHGATHDQTPEGMLAGMTDDQPMEATR